MNATTTELDQRQSNGITVTLLWNPDTGDVSVHVRDDGAGEQFQIRCAPHDALTVFHHPYAYAASRCESSGARTTVES